MATDVRKLGFGALVLVASSILILGTGFTDAPIPDPMAAAAAIGLAVGSLLVGLSEDDAAV